MFSLQFGLDFVSDLDRFWKFDFILLIYCTVIVLCIFCKSEVEIWGCVWQISNSGPVRMMSQGRCELSQSIAERGMALMDQVGGVA